MGCKRKAMWGNGGALWGGEGLLPLAGFQGPLAKGGGVGGVAALVHPSAEDGVSQAVLKDGGVRVPGVGAFQAVASATESACRAATPEAEFLARAIGSDEASACKEHREPPLNLWPLAPGSI